eukprot:scaffold70983_cov51-Phaeocystis_antarctica.AAC.2
MAGSPHTSSYMSGHHPATVRRAGRKRGTRFESRALRLWQSSRQWSAVPWSCIDAAPGCRALRRSSVNMLTAWPGRVAQAPRAGRTRAPWSCSPCCRPSREPHGSGTSYSSTTNRTRKSRTEVTWATCRPRVTSVGDLPTSSLSAPQLIPE